MRSVQPVHRKVSHPPSTDPHPNGCEPDCIFWQMAFAGRGWVSHPSPMWMNAGIAPRKSGSVCSLMAAWVERDGAQANRLRHRSIVLESSVLILCGSDQHQARRRPRRACGCGAGFDANGAWPRSSSHALNSARATLGWRSRTAPTALTPSSAKTFLARPIQTKPMDMLSASESGAESSHFPSRHLVAAPHFAHGSGRASPGHSSGVTNPTDAKPAPSQEGRTVNRLTALFLNVALAPLAHAQGVGEAESARSAVEAFLQGLQRARIQLCSRLHD